MSVQLIGLIFAALAGLALLHSSRAAFMILAIACLFQAAAAIIVTAIGGASITPAHLVLGFFTLAVILRRKGLSSALSALRFPRPGTWLAMMTLWAVMTGFVMPRLFYGTFEVYPLGIQNSLGIIAPIPVGPVSSNMTQSVYFIGNLIAFLMTAGLARSHGLLRSAAFGILVATIVNLAFVLIDQLTFAIGRSDLLDFMRNAGYGQLFHATVLGMKRITGTFPEASSFAGFGIGLFAFSLRLWRGGVFTKLSGPLAAVMFATLILSTATTAYVALAAFLPLVYANTFSGLDPELPRNRSARARRGILFALVPVGALSLATLYAIKPDMFSGIADFFREAVLSKVSSALESPSAPVFNDSGGERSRWNMAGLQVIASSYGLGAGLGSVRTSSFLIGLPANIGILGAILFALFFASLFRRIRPARGEPSHPESIQIAAAARSALLAVFIAAAASAGTADLGIMFYIYAGLASASVFQTVSFDRTGTTAPLPEPYLPTRTRRGRSRPEGGQP